MNSKKHSWNSLKFNDKNVHYQNTVDNIGNWKKLKHSTIENGLNKLWYIHTLRQYFAAN